MSPAKRALLDRWLHGRSGREAASRLTAYVVTRDGSSGAAELREYLQSRLPAYMVPATIVELEELPHTASGKIDRRTLEEMSAPHPQPTETFVAPRTEFERRIASVWKEILAIESCGVEDNFFELGGHSLLLMRVQAKLRKTVPAAASISVIDLFQFPTIGALAAEIERRTM